MTLIQCPNCKKDIPDISQFCSFCGYKLPPKEIDERNRISCPNCKKNIPKDSKYCNYCGKKVIVEIPPQAKKIIPERSLTKCPNCKRDISATSDKCNYCEYDMVPQVNISKGKQLIQCPKCHKDNVNTSFKCAYCGFRLRPEIAERIEEEKSLSKFETVIKWAPWILIVLVALVIIKLVSPQSPPAGKYRNIETQSKPATSKTSEVSTKDPGVTADIHKFRSERMVMSVNGLSVPFDIVSYHTIDFTNKKVVIQINEDYDNPNYTRFNIVSESTSKSGNSVIATLNLKLIGGGTKEQELINKLVFSTSLGTLFYSGNGTLLTYGQLSVVE